MVNITNKKLALIFLLVTLVTIKGAVADTVSVQVIGNSNSSAGDAWLAGGSAANRLLNNGAGSFIRIADAGSSATSTGVYYFDIAEFVPSGANITNLTLTLYCSDGNVNNAIPAAFVQSLVNWTENSLDGVAGNVSMNTPYDGYTNGTTDLWTFTDAEASATWEHFYPEVLGRTMFEGSLPWVNGKTLDIDLCQRDGCETAQEWLDDRTNNFGILINNTNDEDGDSDGCEGVQTKESGANEPIWFAEFDVSDLPPTVTWNDESPSTNSVYNASTLPDPLSFYFQVDDPESEDPLEACHLKYNSNDSVIDSIYSPNLNTNYSLNFTGGFSTDDTYQFYIDCDDGTNNGSSSTKNIIYDTTPPTIPQVGLAFPLADNTSTAFNSRSVPFNITCTDSNPLFSFEWNVTALNGSTTGFYVENINTTSYVYNTAQDFGYLPNGTTTIDMVCYDQHTAKKIPDYYTYEDLTEGTLGYQTGSDTIIVMAAYTADLVSIDTEKKGDRYDFKYEYLTGQEKYKFYVYSTSKLHYMADSEYPAHFITGQNWIDFDLNDPNAKYKVDQIEDNVYEIEIETEQKELHFNSVGGLNKGTQSATFRLGNEGPTTPTTIQPANNTNTANSTIYLYCNGSTDPDNDTIFYDYKTGTDPLALTTTCLNVPENNMCAWNTTTEQTQYWTCAANDTYFSTNETLPRAIYQLIGEKISLNDTAPISVLEGETFTAYANISWNEILIPTYNSLHFLFNGSSYAATRTAQTNYSEFSVTLQAPEVILPDNITYTWDLNLTYDNGSSYNNNSFTGSIDVQNIFFTENCTTNGTDAVYANFSFWSEQTNTELDIAENESQIDWDATFTMYKDDVRINHTRSYSLDNISSFQLCGPLNEEYTTLANIEYIKDLYDKREYYFVNETLNNDTLNVPLYLLEIALGTGITIDIKDTAGNLIDDAYLHVQKYFAGTDNYTLVSMGLTDADGSDYLYLRQYDTFYRILAYKNGLLIYQDTVNRKIQDTTVTLILDELGAVDLIRSFQGISYTLTNTSSQITLTYSDTGTDVSEYCLTVYRTNSTDNQYVCDTCLTTSSGTITCPITSDGNYIASAWTKINPRFPFAVLIIEHVTRTVSDWGKTGLFGAILVLLTFAGLGAHFGKVSTTIGMTLVGLIICKLFGLIIIGYPIILGIIISGGVVMIWAKS